MAFSFQFYLAQSANRHSRRVEQTLFPPFTATKRTLFMSFLFSDGMPRKATAKRREGAGESELARSWTR